MSIELDFELSATCYECKAERPLEGKKIASGDQTVIVMGKEPCEVCLTERRIRVSWGIGVVDGDPQTPACVTGDGGNQADK